MTERREATIELIFELALQLRDETDDHGLALSRALKILINDPEVDLVNEVGLLIATAISDAMLDLNIDLEDKHDVFSAVAVHCTNYEVDTLADIKLLKEMACE